MARTRIGRGRRASGGTEAPGELPIEIKGMPNNPIPRYAKGIEGKPPITGGTEAPTPGRKGGRGKMSVGRSGQAGLGPQLTRRLQSGEITEEEAKRTAQQRQTLAKAFGTDWRSKVFGGKGRLQKTRVGLSKNPGDATLAALNKKLLGQRSSMLEQARKKLKEEGETKEGKASE